MKTARFHLGPWDGKEIEVYDDTCSVHVAVLTAGMLTPRVFGPDELGPEDAQPLPFETVEYREVAKNPFTAFFVPVAADLDRLYAAGWTHAGG